MLGNIRFVGELFKVGLMSSNIIFSCINDLLGEGSSDHTKWKSVVDDQDIECLCHLMTTVGEKLESKSKTEKQLENIFGRIKVLAKDKSLNSRLRFSLDEVVQLKQNNWQKRRALEGPLKISEIHQKIQEEHSNLQHQQQLQHHQQQQQQHGFARSSVGKNISTTAVASSSNYQQQQQQHRSILSRPKSTQDVRKSTGRIVTSSSSSATSEQLQQSYLSSSNESDLRQQQQHHLQSVITNAPRSRASTTSVSSVTSNNSISNCSSDGYAQPVYSQSQQFVDMKFTDDKMRNRAQGIVREYLEQGDVNEVVTLLTESVVSGCNCTMYSYFLLQILKACNETTDKAQMTKLLKLLTEPNIVTGLLGVRAEIEAALFSYEDFQALVDFTIDVKEVSR